MSQFRTTADLKTSVLRRCGENTDGTSPYDVRTLDYLNQIHYTVITGGSEFNIQVDEPWVWARARKPLILELQTVVTAGTVALTQGSVSGTFSSAPAASLEGYFIRLDNGPELYKITQHTAALTAFSIDAAFPQTSVTAQTFKAFLLDYDLVSTYITIDSQNDSLDFIESGTTVLTASVTHGSYTPAGLATAVAAALNAAGTHGNTYSCTYDTNRRYFTVTSNLLGSGTPIFQPQGAGTNYYRSTWNTLGFDYLAQTGAATYSSAYAHGTVLRLTEPGRGYYSSLFNYGDAQGSIGGIDPLTMDRDYPLSEVKAGAPTAFSVIREKPDGTQTVRFNKYPSDRKMRVEFEHVPIPKDLQNNAQSIPLIPRKFIRLLEYGAAFYILTDKRDTKAQSYFNIAQQTLQAMLKFNRKELERTGKYFGQVVARPELMPDHRRGRLNDYGYTSGNT